MISRWEPGPSNRASYDGVVATIGGPDSRYLPEHEHPDLQLSVHLGRFSNVRVTAPSEPHAGGWDDGERVAVVLLSPALLDEVADDVVRRGRWNFRSGNHPEDHLARELGRAVWEEFESPSSVLDRGLYFHSIGYALAAHLLRRYCDAPTRRPSRDVLTRAQLSRLREFLDGHQGRPVALAEMGSALGLRPRAFADAFKRTTGRTAYQYALHRRVLAAKKLLRLGSLSIGEIALQCGFSSQSHFTSTFVRLVGATPARWRASGGCTSSHPATGSGCPGT